MTISIKKTGDATLATINMLVYGDAGVGKTRLAATTGAPPERVLVVSSERGTLSIKNDNLDMVEVNSIDDLREIYVALNDGSLKGRYDWVFIDSLTDIADTLLSAEKGKTENASRANNFAPYSVLLERVNAVVKAYRNLPVNVVFIAQSEREEFDGVKYIAPKLPGKALHNSMPYQFDFVLCLRVESDAEGRISRFLHTQSDNRYICKDRSGKLDIREKPDLSHIYSLVTSVSARLDDEQIETLRRAIDAAGMTEADFVALWGGKLSSIESLSVKNFEKSLIRLAEKAKESHRV